MLLLLCNLEKHGLLTYENIQRSLPVNFQYSFKWVLQLIWNYSICVRHSGYVLYVRVYNCDWQMVESPLFFVISFESRIPLFARILNFKRARADQGSSEGLFTSTSWVSKGYKMDQKVQLWRQIMWTCWCGRGNILGLSDFWDLSRNIFEIKKTESLLDGQKHAENYKPILTSVPTSLSWHLSF